MEDNPRDEALIRVALSMDPQRHFNIRTSRAFRSALHLAQSRPYDAILLKLRLPDSAGLENVRELALTAPRAAIVIMMNADDDALIVESCEVGAGAYLVKDRAEPQALSRAIRCAIARKRYEAGLAQQAYFDSLTGLANRGLFNDRLRQALARAARADKRLGLLFVDLDHFKQVNDRFGHRVGDGVLRCVAHALLSAVRRTDTVARFGGDEFAVLLEPVEDVGDVDVVARKVLSAARAPITAGNEPAKVSVTVSIGIAVFPEDGSKAEELIESADAAMFLAKRDGGDRCHPGGGSSDANCRPGSSVHAQSTQR